LSNASVPTIATAAPAIADTRSTRVSSEAVSSFVVRSIPIVMAGGSAGDAAARLSARDRPVNVP